MAGRKPRALTPREIWDAEHIERAVAFTTARFLGRGQYDRREFPVKGKSKRARDAALALARADAKGDRRAMIYAISPEGFSIHLVNGDTV